MNKGFCHCTNVYGVSILPQIYSRYKSTKFNTCKPDPFVQEYCGQFKSLWN